MHHPIREVVMVRKDKIGFFGVAHIFLNTEIVHAEIEVERSGKTHGTQIGRPVRTSKHMKQLGKARDLAQVADASRVYHRRAYVIYELLADELLTIVDGVEHLAHR